MIVLLIDMPNICWRAFHSSQSFDDKVEGTLFGVFRTLLDLQRRFQTERMAFCFDGVGSQRKELFPAYKQSRLNRTPAEQKERANVVFSMAELRNKLRSIGYKNLFQKDGFEADDCIASIIDEQNGKDFVVVSTDTDLYQLLDYGMSSVIQYLPVRKVVYTIKQFQSEFCGLEPHRWPEIKAIAGCKTDDIPGVPGVGNKTAAKFLAGKLSKSCKAYRAIVENAHVKAANLPLVKLPFEGAPKLKLVEDGNTRKGWAKVLKELGLSQLLGSF